MFDPSKLNIDLDNLDNNNSEKNKKKDTIETNNSSEKKINEENNTSDNNDILNQIDNEPKYYWLDNIENHESENNTQETQTPIIKNTVYDINIKSLENILNLIIEKEYDFVTIEPSDQEIKISFKKDNTEKEVKYIKYPTYTNILLKAKTTSKLVVDNTQEEQLWNWEITLKNKIYKLFTKTVPSDYWEKIFLKPIEEKWKKVVKKEKKKTSLWQIMWFLWGLLFAILIIWWAFLAFILLNSSNVADLTFFNNLWVDVWSIKEFTAKLVDFIFVSIIFIETIFLFVFTFKSILTKKEFKQKRISRIVLAIFFLILVMISWFLWLTLSKKINSLKWLNYWKIEFYDNSKYLSDLFDESWSKVNINDLLIWPITIRFNIEEFMNKLKDDWFVPQKLIWFFWYEEIEKPIEDYELIKTFNIKWPNIVTLKIEWLNIKWENEIFKNEIWNINISNTVNITENKTDNWGSIFNYDANDLKNLWKIKWYYIPDLTWKTEIEKTNIINDSLENEILEWYNFTSKIIFDQEIVLWLKIITKWKINKDLDKIFIISKNESDSINWEIKYITSLDNDLEYTLFVSNPETKLWEWIIEEFKWKIQDKEITKKANITNLEESSKHTHTFKQYWTNKVSVIIKDSRWKIKELSTIIETAKKLILEDNLDIYNQEEIIENIKYDKTLNEYFINQVWIPTTIKFDAKKIRWDKSIKWNYPLHILKEVIWDFDSDWDTDKKWKQINFDINREWTHSISVTYVFVHIKKKDDIIKIKENIYIEWIKKEAILNIWIEKEWNYVPITVKFDASKSIVNNEDIVKFIWDYWDWISEERDAIVQWHKYSKPWNYDIKLTVITENWKEFSTSKKLILKPKPQNVEISSSMKKAPIWQWIDFYSDWSEWQITSYFWDFWEWSTSIDANPTHYFYKPWKYIVKLKLDFDNNNVLEDQIIIEIYEE